MTWLFERTVECAAWIAMIVAWAAAATAAYWLVKWFGTVQTGADAELLENSLHAAGISVGFLVLRATNLYGDPAAWARQEGLLATVLSFLNCEKYPPSLLYLMMTLGPGLLLLAAFQLHELCESLEADAVPDLGVRASPEFRPTHRLPDSRCPSITIRG